DIGIGTGNLAHHLAARFVKKGHEIIQVIGRSEVPAKALGQKFFTSHSTDLKKINRTADIYVICISDSQIERLASALKLNGKLVLHTSGSIPMKALVKASGKYGVIYPLQTFSKDAKAKWKNMTLLIEGNAPAVTNEIRAFASTLCKDVREFNSSERLKLHVAAVFVSNFTNHLYTLASEFLEAEKTGHFDLLKPLILETAKKIKKLSPAQAQTGPAIRNDKNTIEKHLAILEKYKTHRELYASFTKSILHSKNKSDGKL
ncbi:MAG: Rossmann-like and DUF2520 domain-containing protein, partial [Bacteroidia bacterium]